MVEGVAVGPSPWSKKLLGFSGFGADRVGAWRPRPVTRRNGLSDFGSRPGPKDRPALPPPTALATTSTGGAYPDSNPGPFSISPPGMRSREMISPQAYAANHLGPVCLNRIRRLLNSSLAPDDLEALRPCARRGESPLFFRCGAPRRGLEGNEVELEVAPVVDGEEHLRRMLAPLARLLGRGFDAFDRVSWRRDFIHGGHEQLQSKSGYDQRLKWSWRIA